jgi:hypothetical protein
LPLLLRKGVNKFPLQLVGGELHFAPQPPQLFSAGSCSGLPGPLHARGGQRADPANKPPAPAAASGVDSASQLAST